MASSYQNDVTSETTSARSCLTISIRYAALWSFSVAHSIYNVLSHSPEFFTAHRADQAALALTIALLSFAPPAGLALLELGARRLSRRLGRATALTLTTILFAAAAVQFLRPIGLPGAIEVAFALGGGLLAAAALLRARVGRVAVVALSPIVLVSPALLWFDKDIALALDSKPEYAVEGWSDTNGTPIVLLVFDALPTAALLDEKRAIDRVRWPELAALADTATWYRNATAVSTLTTSSVPALLTGKYPSDRRPPTIAAHPRNLFTLLDGSYSLNVSEMVTALAPVSDESERKSHHRVAEDMLVDAAVVYGHVVVPPDFRSGLPSVDTQPAFFGRRRQEAASSDGAPTEWARFVTARFEQIDEFLKGLSGRKFTLSYLHQMNPHPPWQLVPSGRRYTSSNMVPGRVGWTGPWPVDPGMANAARQRYLLQAGTVDTALGRIVRRLKELGTFDRTLLIVTADHGMTFTPDRNARWPEPDTYLDIIYVPLVIKYPGQTKARTNDANVELVDVLSTIAEVLGVEPGEGIDGQSLRSGTTTRGQTKTFQSRLGGPFELAAWPVPGGGEFSQIQPQIEGMAVREEGPWVRPRTPCDDLLGKQRLEIREYLRHGEDIPVRINSDPGGYGGTGAEEFEQGWIVGRLTPPSPFDGEPLIAVSVGGRIEEIVRTFSSPRSNHEFSALLPAPLSGRSGPVAIDVLDPAHPRCGAASSWSPKVERGLSFSRSDSDNYGRGWAGFGVSSNGEATWCWAIGQRAVLFLALPKKPCKMSFYARTHAANAPQTMTVNVDGAVVGSRRVPTGPPQWISPIQIPAASDRPRISLVELEFAKSNLPKNADTRKLAVCFHELKIE